MHRPKASPSRRARAPQIRSSGAMRRAKGTDVPGFIALQGRIYPLVGVPIIVGWLALRGYIFPTAAWAIGGIAIAALQFLVLPLVKSLLGEHVSLPGCGVGQIVYWASMAGLTALYWQGGFDMLAIGALLLPAFVIGISMIATRIAH